MNDMLVFLAQSLVDHPDDVSVMEKRQGPRVILELRVHADDMGRVIGRQGRTAKAIRSVMRAIADRQGERVTVEIVG